jgi:hypothetical protein
VKRTGTSLPANFALSSALGSPAVNHGDRRKDRCEQVAEIRGVLDRRLGVPVPLDDHALGLIVVEVEVVSQRARLLRRHDLRGLIGQAQVLVALALVKFNGTAS